MTDPASGEPRGIEVLLKKASVDRAFRALLLEKRDGAADAIGLTLSPSEAVIIRGIPPGQLAAMIRGTEVQADLRPVFRSAAAALMLAALSAGSGVRAEEGPPLQPTPATTTTPPRVHEAELKRRMVCKVMPGRTRMVVIAGVGVTPPNLNESEREWIELPPESTPALDKLTAEQVKARVGQLLPKLADEAFEVREQATLRLMQLGQRVRPLIADLKPEDLEVATRLARVRTALEAARRTEGKLKLVKGQWEWHPGH